MSASSFARQRSLKSNPELLSTLTKNERSPVCIPMLDSWSAIEPFQDSFLDFGIVQLWMVSTYILSLHRLGDLVEFEGHLHTFENLGVADDLLHDSILWGHL